MAVACSSLEYKDAICCTCVLQVFCKEKRGCETGAYNYSGVLRFEQWVPLFNKTPAAGEFILAVPVSAPSLCNRHDECLMTG